MSEYELGYFLLGGFIGAGITYAICYAKVLDMVRHRLEDDRRNAEEFNKNVARFKDELAKIAKEVGK